jgi:hypothetical protein
MDGTGTEHVLCNIDVSNMYYVLQSIFQSTYPTRFAIFKNFHMPTDARKCHEAIPCRRPDKSVWPSHVLIC